MTGQTTVRRMRLVAAAVSLLLVSFLVMQTSSAVFSGSTSNTGNEVTAGNVSISDDLTGGTLFSVQDVVPNDSIVRCVIVTYTGDAVGDDDSGGDLDSSGVVLHANTDYNDTAGDSVDFSSQLNLTVERDSDFTRTGDGSSTDCAGFSADTSGGTLYDGSSGKTVETFTDTDLHTDYSSGLSTGWVPSATSETRGFRFTIEFDGAAGNDFQDAVLGTTTPLDFTWEVQSGDGNAK